MLNDLPELRKKLEQSAVEKQFRSSNRKFDPPKLTYSFRKYVDEWPADRKDLNVPLEKRHKKYKSRFFHHGRAGYSGYWSIGYQNATDVIKSLTRSQKQPGMKFWCLNDCRSVCPKKNVNCTELDIAIGNYLQDLLPCAPWEASCV